MAAWTGYISRLHSQKKQRFKLNVKLSFFISKRTAEIILQKAAGNIKNIKQIPVHILKSYTGRT